LAEVLEQLPKPKSENLLLGLDIADDAGIYKISAEIALIQTTDFFTPVCSNAYEFGQIAAANSLSDVYAMGGKPITALNIVMFPNTKIPMDVYAQILLGGHDKVTEAGAVIIGGHTIDDDIPKYGLAVTGTVHPERFTANSNAKPGDILILTKPIGTGVIITGKSENEVSAENYRIALDYMKMLNKTAAEVMQKFNVRAATDITGFSLIGHAKNIASASGVSLKLESNKIPLLPGAYELADMGCIPGASFKNQKFLEQFCGINDIDYNVKMLMFDAQTSGGILMCIKPNFAERALQDLKQNGCPDSAIVGEVTEKKDKDIFVV
jgi:selenide, water dikinase